MSTFFSHLFTGMTVSLLMVAVNASLSACTPQKDSKPSAKTASLAPELKLNAPLFEFNPAETRELSIVKNDPTTGDHWTARIINSAIDPGRSENPEWKIASSSLNVIDDRADGLYLSHLLDTFRTLQAFEKAGDGPLSSFGLTPPLFALRWGAFEIHLGDSNPKQGGTYAYLPIQAMQGSQPAVYLVRGAALEMLTHLAKFEALRLKKLVTFESREVQAIRVSGLRSRWSVMRAGTAWQDPFFQRLEALTHLRILRFIDDSTETEKLKALFGTSRIDQATFSDSRNQQTLLQVVQKDGKTFAKLSSRPKAVFEVYPELLNFFRPLTQP